MVELLIAHEDPRASSALEAWRPNPTPEAWRAWGARSGEATRLVGVALDAVREAPTILDAIQASPLVVQRTAEALGAGVGPTELLPIIREAIADESDTVTAVAAIHGLGLIPGSATDDEIERLICKAVHGFDAHILWAMQSRPLAAALVPHLSDAIARGGLAGMHAQRVLARWAATSPGLIFRAIEDSLADTGVAASRRYLVETMGLIRGREASQALGRIASDSTEVEAVRAEAVMAFSDRLDERLPRSIARLAAVPGGLADAVHLARAWRMLARRGPHRGGDRAAGIKVAQVHLAAVLDAQASRAGMGDTGGVATLLPRLGAALAEQARIREVVTIGRSEPGALSASGQPANERASGHRFDAVPLQAGEGAAFASAWPSLVAAERGVRAALLASDLPDVIHLRMADPGSLAASHVARQLGIPMVFTLAPDPHLPVSAAERKGSLDRRTFAARDAGAALWFRARLVEQLGREASQVVLFPRPQLRRSLEELLGKRVFMGSPRHTVIAEGVDARQAHDAHDHVAAGRMSPALSDLRRSIGRLPGHRHGLPIVISVGRMSEIKGMARIVEAFARDEQLGATANLVIVGGDLREPSATEAAELARIHALFDGDRGLDQRVVLLGHRAHAETALLLAATRHGLGDYISPGGAYVCGSLKEEFGLAIAEAMAAGLPVVAPAAGGPATYVEAGVTGMLVDTADPQAIAYGVREALRLARDPATSARARDVIEARFTLGRMAQALAAVYRVASGARTLALPVEESRAA